MFNRFLATFFALTSLVLSGCASTRVVDAQVQSFERTGTTALSKQASFSFERLPSQASAGEAGTGTQAKLQASVENAVAERLRQFGWQAATSNPEFTVLVAARSTRVDVPWNAQWPWPHPYWDNLGRHPVLLRNGNWAWVSPIGTSFPARSVLEPSSAHELSVLVRNRSTGDVVFEAQARSASRARPGTTDAIDELVILAQAALSDFPKATGALLDKRIEIQSAR